MSNSHGTIAGVVGMPGDLGMHVLEETAHSTIDQPDGFLQGLHENSSLDRSASGSSQNARARDDLAAHVGMARAAGIEAVSNTAQQTEAYSTTARKNKGEFATPYTHQSGSGDVSVSFLLL
jgi:hypothetical protein